MEYTCHSTGLISTQFVPEPQKILKFYRVFNEQCQRAMESGGGHAFGLEDYCTFSLQVDLGNLYWGDLEDNFSPEQFTQFMQICIQRGWLEGPLEGTYSYSSSERCGGGYFQVLTNQILLIDTDNLHQLFIPELTKLSKFTSWKEQLRRRGSTN